MNALRRQSFDHGTFGPPGSIRAVLLAMAILLGALSAAHAAVALLLEQPYGKLNLIAPAGHSAIYLDHVCAATPLKLRACLPGEHGVVLSRYDGIGGHDWIAMPLIPYLYAVDDAAEIPETMDRDTEVSLRDDYRRQYLQTVAPDMPDGSAPGGNWYELLGSAFDRTIYGFSVKTTADQDAQLIATFNDRRNIEVYNGAFRNCADFARVTLNRFYPHAVRRNFISELGMTSPKSVARSLSRYAKKHPETGFRVFMIPQVKGTLPRSHSNTGLAEGILKRFGVPLTVVSPVTTAVVLAVYIGDGRFSLPKDPPVLDVGEAEVEQVEIDRPFPLVAPVLPAPEVAMVSPLAMDTVETTSRVALARGSGAEASFNRTAMGKQAPQ
jgi:hypothetical protein